MLISNLRRETKDADESIVATVSWEDTDRPTRDLYFRLPKAFSAFLVDRMEPFLAGCVMPAMRYGEKRVSIEGAVCPVFLEGVRNNLDWFHAWYGDEWQPPTIESKVDAEPVALGNMGGRVSEAALFLSGGIDSLSTLIRNVETVPRGHPAAFRRCVIVHGFDFYPRETQDPRLEAFDEAVAAMERVTAQIDAYMVPLFTNIRHLDPNDDFWIYQFHGACLGAAAQAVSGGMHSMMFASGDVPRMVPYGSHPLVDVNWSSHALRIYHDTMRYSRLEKVAQVATWPVALANLRVCTRSQPGRPNCGKCEKCLRTMLMLLCHDKLVGASFPANDVTPSDLRGIRIVDPYQVLQYRMMVPRLRAKGRDDLAIAIRGKLLSHRANVVPSLKAWTVRTVKRIDSHHLDGFLKRVARG